MKSFDIDSSKFARISGFLTVGYRDYLAARTLLINGLLFRGIILSATAIEKLLKVFIVLNGSSKKTHQVDKLFAEVITFDAELSKKLNEDFMDFLSRSYNLRYFDNQVFNNPSKPFKLSVAQYKTLAELDFTAITILNSISVSINGHTLKSEYHEHLDEKHDLLFNKNFLLCNIRKDDFIQQKQYVFQIMSIKEGIVDRTYQTENVKDDGIFLFKDER
ncbi:HEPN domain-containing protein [Neobacillus sp. 114]|uniref:HEPN domain-containing protein n=1 Tax=Neobacillus sp. 114 TaxID=3048535 RepID=UPI0024C31797|nr:HEPN domain-containing protein [Neobacillus sp. 114]